MNPTNIKAKVIQQPQQCDQLGPRNSRLFTGGPDLEFVTVNVPAIVGAVAADILVQFNRPHKLIFIASITDAFQSASIYFHLSQLGFGSQYATAGNTLATTGKEPYLTWWKTAAITGGMQSRYVKFRTPVQQFYIDADHTAGNPAGGYFVTFGGSDDIDYMNVMQGGN